jgi:hypothetical protein
MKRLTIVLLSVVAVIILSSPVFGQYHNNMSQGQGQGQAVQGPPPFVPASVQNGKALVYIYWEGNCYDRRKGILVTTETGPIGVLEPGTYISFVADPGTYKLWLIGGGGVPEYKWEAVADQIYYARVGSAIMGPELELIRDENAKKQLAACLPFKQDESLNQPPTN